MGVCRDRVSAPRRLEHVAHQRGPAVLRTLRQKVGVRIRAVVLQLVIAELRRCLLPRSHARPHGDRTLDRFEIEEADPAVKCLQRLLETRLDDQAILPHRADLPLLRHVELLLCRQIRNAMHACEQEGAALLRSDA